MAATLHDMTADGKAVYNKADGTERVRTSGGTWERGTANQRHLVREIEPIDGIQLVVSYPTNHVAISIKTIEAIDPLTEACERYGFRATLERNYPSTGHVKAELELIQ